MKFTTLDLNTTPIHIITASERDSERLINFANLKLTPIAQIQLNMSGTLQLDNKVKNGHIKDVYFLNTIEQLPRLFEITRTAYDQKEISQNIFIVVDCHDAIKKFLPHSPQPAIEEPLHKKFRPEATIQDLQ